MKKFNYSFKAVGSIINIQIIWENQTKADSTANTAYQETVYFEKKFSRFLENSKLNQLNRNKKIYMDQDFLGVFFGAKEIYYLTGGYYNPLLNPSTIGYNESFEQKNFEKKNIQENTNFENIGIFGNTIQLQEWMNMDFGGIWKGYLADKLWKLIQNKWYTNYMINIGGDILVKWNNLQQKPRKVGIKNPKDNSIIEYLSFNNKSVSTSWIYERHRKINKEKFHHIKTPWSNTQPRDLLSVTVIDDKTYKTDALATSILSMGYSKWKDFCQQNNIKAILITNQDTEKINLS